MVIRIWEHEDAAVAAERIEIAVRQAQPNSSALVGVGRVM
jgi:hypothetical protein